MKKIICFVAMLMLCVVFSACGETVTTNENVVMLKPVDNLLDYVIVRGDLSSIEETKLATRLRESINEATGSSVEVKTDFSNSTYEILVGSTKRQQSIDAMEGLKYYDYTVKKDGDKIVIVGGSSEALEKAIELFEKYFIDSVNKTLNIPIDEGYSYKWKYAVESLTIDGTDISNFKIYNNSLEDITTFREGFRSFCGIDIALNEGAMVNGGHYIIVDGSELVSHKYSIFVENGNLVIKGSAHSIPVAMDYFLNNFISGKDLVLEADTNYEGSTGKKETYTKDQLAQVIQKLYDDPNVIAIGEEVIEKDAYAIENAINGFYETTKQKPGIIGIDLACYGIDLTRINDVTLSSYICDIVDYVSDGGIVTVSAHWANPSQTDPDRVRGNFGTVNTLEAYQQAFTDLITEGTEYNTFFKAELEVNARFFKALEENGVPIIWRPLHEANGDWFWFCVGQQEHWLDSQYIVNIWHYIYNYFENECGLTNLFWNYSPNVSSNMSNTPGGAMGTTYLYPGDEYCDMVGVDWYTTGNLEVTKGDNYSLLLELSKKPGAITEFGPSGSILANNTADQPDLYSCMDMYANLYELVRDGYSFTYLLTWGSVWGVEAMGYGEEMMNTDLCIGLTEVKALFDTLK